MILTFCILKDLTTIPEIDNLYGVSASTCVKSIWFGSSAEWSLQPRCSFACERKKEKGKESPAGGEACTRRSGKLATIRPVCTARVPPYAEGTLDPV
jgi:hypothetical protein